MRFVVTGANRGIGLEFARQLLDRGDDVVGTARRPDEADELRELGETLDGTLEIVELDVTEQDTIDALADHLGDRPVDVLINNAATMIGAGTLDDLNEEAMFDSFDVNTLGPLRVTAALLDNLQRADHARIVNVTSKMGSIFDNTSGGSYAYRTSKAALNMATRSMAVDLKPKGIVAFVIHPGWVQTRMGGQNALIDTETSVSNMLPIIDDAGHDVTGTFQEWDGGTIPW